MNARLVTKLVVRTIVTTCVGFTVSNVLSSNANTDKTHQKAEVLVGSFVVGMMVSEVAGTHSDVQVDKFFDTVTSFKNTHK